MNSATFEAIRRGDAKLTLSEPLDWKRKGSQLRATHRVKTVLSNPITVVASLLADRPYRPTFLIHDGAPGKNNACRLDLRSSHTNRRTDGRHWERETHLHLWRDDRHEAHAVDPFQPWPPTWFREDDTQITSEQLKELFETFCRMFHVELGGTYHWVDPLPLITSQPVITTEDGDVVP